MAFKKLSYWLAALYLPGVGPRTFLRWLAAFPDIEALFSATSADWEAAGIDATYFTHCIIPTGNRLSEI